MEFSRDFSNLNQTQIEAVQYTEGPLLIIAGAGTGKTTVITSRISNIIQQNLCFPSQILAVTFTNKAAMEMKNRIMANVGPEANNIWIGTFHSISIKILRKHAELVGLTSDFNIIDEDDQEKVVKQILIDMEVSLKEFPPKAFVNAINNFKDLARAPGEIADVIKENKIYLPKLQQVYNRYQNDLRNFNSVDFGDIILYVIQIFRNNSDVMKFYQNRFKYVMVDEYQDTNHAQYLWVSQMVGASMNICCVGDDDQSIYGWRGADIENILRFEHDFSNAKIIKLEKNYRSTANILNCASNIIQNNQMRHVKILHNDSAKTNDKVQVISFADDRQEANFLMNTIAELHDNYKQKYSEIGVLIRASYQSRIIEEAFIKNQIPYRVVGGLKFYDKKEIRDAIAYLRLLHNKNDNLAFERVINTPKRGIGETSIAKIRLHANESGISLFDASEKICENGGISGKTKDGIMSLVNLIKSAGEILKTSMEGDGKIDEVLKFMMNESGYIISLRNEGSIQSKSRIENIDEFINSVSEFENLSDFLEHVSISASGSVDESGEKNQDMVSIMTIHSAKGLEFSTVFLPGWEEGIFPSPRSVTERNGLEEERRLAYVAITRAKRYLYISNTKQRMMFGELVQNTESRFVKELPEANINRNDFTYNSYYNRAV